MDLGRISFPNSMSEAKVGRNVIKSDYYVLSVCFASIITVFLVIFSCVYGRCCVLGPILHVNTFPSEFQSCNTDAHFYGKG